MECADTLLLIASFLSKRDLVAFCGISKLSRRVTETCLSIEEIQYLVWPCVREEHVELAPPSEILALSVVEKEQRLLVLARCNSETWTPKELECYLYSQQICGESGREERQIALPLQFALPTSQTHFAGGRFLTCTTCEGELFVFDCILETIVDVPMTTDGFYASPNGERFLVDYDRHIYFGNTESHISCWWETYHMDSILEDIYPYNSDGRAPFITSRLRASVQQSLSAVKEPRADTKPILQYFLGSSSSAWRSFWVGCSSVLYGHEEGVVLLKENIQTNSFDSEQLPTLFASCFNLVHCGCGAVLSRKDARYDEYAVVNCRSFNMHTIICANGEQTRVRTLELGHVIPPRVTVKDVRIAVNDCTYLLYLQDQMIDRVLFFSADMSLTRWITVGRPSCFTMSSKPAALITAALPVLKGESYHPLMEAVEGGLGCLFVFGRPTGGSSLSSPIKTLDRSRTTVEIVSDVEDGAVYVSVLGVYPQYFNGVEALSLVAIGVVSGSLLWTLSALCYNGWWLHLQLLLWGKVS